MEKQGKIEQSDRLRSSIQDVSALLLVEFSGLTVADAEVLRNRFREAGCSYRVYKNSTVHYAVAGTPHEPLSSLLKGVTGLAYHEEDPGAPARVARDFAKTNDKLRIKGAVLGGQLLDARQAEVLADMPGPQELKAQLLQLMVTPATNMVRVLAAPMRDFLNVLQAKKDKDAA